MKPCVRWFLLFQSLDILTSAIGWMVMINEGNPLGSPLTLLIYKLIMITCVGLVLQLKRQSKLDKLVPIASGVIVPWNLLNIVLLFLGV